MANPYSGEWIKINKIAKDVRVLLDKIAELQKKAADLQARISRIPYKTNEEGDDINAEKRNALYAQLEYVNAMIDDANEQRESLKSQALRLAQSYQLEARTFEEKANHTSNATSVFDSISSYRFGAQMAAVNAQTTRQREQYYQSYVSILNELVIAAQNAAIGITSSGSNQTVADRGNFHDLNTSRGNMDNSGEERQRQDYQQGWKGIPGESEKISNQKESKALLSNLGAEGIPYKNGQPNFSMAAHAAVPIASSVALLAGADAMLAKRYGITGDEIASYRRENNLEWRGEENGNAVLVPQSLSEEYSEGRIENQEVTAPDELTAYMWAHNYGRADYDEYSKDPEWQYLHRRAFPEKYDIPIEEAERSRQLIIQKTFDERAIPYKEFCGYTVAPSIIEGEYYVVGGDYDSYKKCYDFYKEDFNTRQYIKSDEVRVVDSRLIEGVYVSETDLDKPDGFWNMHGRSYESWKDISSIIPVVQSQLSMGKSVEELINTDSPVGDCARVYFINNHDEPISVMEVDGIYIFEGYGRHRVITAQKMGISVPVLITRVYK